MEPNPGFDYLHNLILRNMTGTLVYQKEYSTSGPLTVTLKSNMVDCYKDKIIQEIIDKYGVSRTTITELENKSSL